MLVKPHVRRESLWGIKKKDDCIVYCYDVECIKGNINNLNNFETLQLWAYNAWGFYV